MLHWIVNPGMAINELFFGQRIPKLSLEDKESNKARFERSYIPCPHCEMIHDSRTWTTLNGTAYRNWFGLYCPNCGEIIPCLRNIFSAVIIALLFPLTYFFKDQLKKRWLKKQANRFSTLDLNSIPNPYDGKGWLLIGLGWGLFMFVLMTFLFPLMKSEIIELRDVITALPIWTIAGVLFGYTMKRMMGTEKPDLQNLKT